MQIYLIYISICCLSTWHYICIIYGSGPAPAPEVGSQVGRWRKFLRASCSCSLRGVFPWWMWGRCWRPRPSWTPSPWTCTRRCVDKKPANAEKELDKFFFSKVECTGIPPVTAVPTSRRRLRTCQLTFHLCATVIVQRQMSTRVQTKPVNKFLRAT